MLRPRTTVLFLIAVILIIVGVGFTARPAEAASSTNGKCHDYKHSPIPPRPTRCQHYSKYACDYVKGYNRKSEHCYSSKGYSYYGKDYRKPSEHRDYSKDYSYYGKDYHKQPGHRDYSKGYSYYGKDYRKPSEHRDYSKDYSYYGKDYHKQPGHRDYSKDYSYYGKDYHKPPWRPQHKPYSNTQTRYLYMRGRVWTLNP